MRGLPAAVSEMLKDYGMGNVQKSRNELQEILLSIRKLREGMMSNARYDQLTVDGTIKKKSYSVYELSVLVSILCEDASQLATSITRLNQDVYGNLDSKAAHDEMLCQTAQNMKMLFHEEPIPASPWLSMENKADPQVMRRYLFEAIWLMESLCSHRPEFLQEYLQRKAFILRDSKKSPGTNVYLDFAQTAYLAVQRNDSMALRGLLTGEPQNRIPSTLRSPKAMADVFWLRVMAQSLVPRVRARSEYIVRRSYLRIPVRPEFKRMVCGEYAHLDDEPTALNDNSLEWVESVLLIDPGMTASLAAGFQQPEPNVHHKANTWRSYLMLNGIARQFGQNQWDQACSYLKPRIVEGTQSFALNLRP